MPSRATADAKKSVNKFTKSTSFYKRSFFSEEIDALRFVWIRTNAR